MKKPMISVLTTVYNGERFLEETIPFEWANFNYDTWYKIYPSWLSKEMIKLVEGVVFLSYFDNKNLAYKYPGFIMKLAFKIYHPIAKLRSDNNFYGLFFEKKLADVSSNLIQKVNKIRGGE